MISKYILLVALVVCGASAKPQSQMHNSGFQSNSFTLNGGYGSSLPVINTHVRTSVVENPTVQIPSFTSPTTTVAESCHCFKTVVRPQIRNEIISVPTVDRLVRTVSTPIIETINYGGNGQADISIQPMSGANSERGLAALFQGSQSGSFSNGNNVIFSTCQNTNSGNFKQNGASMSTFKGANHGIINQQTSSSLTSSGGNFPNNHFTSNSGFPNGANIIGYQVCTSPN